tara:strand:+ start:1231 stop:1905 length:675 start_codon:yes stop_codon:yes gene_type:complete
MWTIIMGVLCLPYLLIPHIYLRKPINLWIFGIFKLLKFICNITYEVTGLENVPNHSIIIASKHQSAFETFALFYYLRNSIFIHKRQLFYIPIFGQYLMKANMISIDRLKGPAAIRKMISETKSKLQNGSSIIIFPEGTRKKPGEAPNYKPGIFGIYSEAETHILPVAVYSGHCWPKHTLLKYPGNISIKFLNLIPPKIDRNNLLKQIEKQIETESKKLIELNKL